MLIKRFIALAFLTVFSTLIYTTYNQKNNSSSVENRIQNLDKAVTENPNAQKTTVVTKENIVNKKSRPSALTPSDTHKLDLWKKSHGYFSENDLDEYRSYDIETIAKLAADGDLKAIELAARHRMQNGGEAYRDFFHAAVYGSTHAFTALSFLIENNFLNEVTEEEKIQHSIEALALLQTAGKRGDILAATENSTSYKNRYKFIPTPEQQKLIDARSQELYDQLVEIRSSIGLGDFDNSVSPEMEKVMRITHQ